MADATHLLLNGDSFIFSPGSYAWCCKSYADYKMKECWVSPGLFEAVEPQARRGAGTAAVNTECCPAHVELDAVTPYFHQCLRNG